MGDWYSGVPTRGICWNTEPNPTSDNFTNYTNSWDIKYSCSMTNLIHNTKYYVRAFVRDMNGIVHYGTQVEFTTLAE